MIPVSFITTVFNEGKSIGLLLESLSYQTKKPDEIVIVDANSTDDTKKIILDFQKKSKLKIKLISSEGNRSVGRNIAIKNAKYEVIACSDSGCELDKDWLKNISKPFENRNVDIVSGFYLTKPRNNFEKSLTPYLNVMPENVDSKNFLPSSRSIAFRKSVWKEVKGYPEWLNTCEDLIFAKKLKEKKYNFIFQKSALVYWKQRNNYKEVIRQFYSYAVGDGVARYIRLSVYLLFLRYLIGILLLGYYLYTHSLNIIILMFILLFGYIIWSIMKNYRFVKNYSGLFYLPSFQFISDIAVIVGTTVGLIKGIGIKRT